MKQLLNSRRTGFIILHIVFFTFFGCNNDSSSGEESTQTTDTSSTKDNGGGTTGNKEEDIKEKLANQAPISGDDLKLMLPKQIQGGSAENLDYSSSTGATVATADYIINDSTKVQLSLVDCSGPAGSGFYATQYQDRVASGGAEGIKIISFRGSSAILESTAGSPETSLTWFDGNRYLLTLYGGNISEEELKKIAGGISIR